MTSTSLDCVQAPPPGSAVPRPPDLYFAVVAQAWCGTTNIPTAASRDAIIAALGATAADIIVHPFYPENFLIACSSQAVRDRVLAAYPLLLGATSLELRPWMRLAHADMSALLYSVSLELEGLLPHVWHGFRYRQGFADDLTRAIAPFKANAGGDGGRRNGSSSAATLDGEGRGCWPTCQRSLRRVHFGGVNRGNSYHVASSTSPASSKPTKEKAKEGCHLEVETSPDDCGFKIRRAGWQRGPAGRDQHGSRKDGF